MKHFILRLLHIRFYGLLSALVLGVFIGTVRGQVAIPTFSPSGGRFGVALDVIVSCTTSGAVIRYTVDGSDPTQSDSFITSGSTVLVGRNLELKAKAWASGTCSTTGTAQFWVTGMLSGGCYHMLALSPDGSQVWSWGNNGYNQLGDGTSTSRSTPALVKTGSSTYLTGIDEVAAGGIFSMALGASGSLWAWGNNTYGQLGNGNKTQQKFAVQALQSGTNPMTSPIKSVVCGYVHTVALCDDGSVWCWGRNTYSSLGSGNTTDSMSPVRVKTSGSTYLTNVVNVTANYYHNLAIKSDGSLWGWGLNSYGQLGIGSLINSFYAVQITGSSATNPVIAVAAGCASSMALKKDGSVWVWGDNNKGEIGNGTTSTTMQTTPSQVMSSGAIPFLNAVGIAVAGDLNTYSTCFAVTNDGAVWAWGFNYYGSIGNGTSTSPDHYSYPVQVMSSATTFLTDVMTLSTTPYTCMAIQTNGLLQGWGWNYYGVLGPLPGAELYATNGGASMPVLADNPPTVSLTVSPAGTYMVGPLDITLSANAQDPDGNDTLAGVDFYYNGDNLIDSVYETPYQITGTATSPGEYTLTAVASDIYGLSATSSPVNITVLLPTAHVNVSVPVSSVTETSTGSAIFRISRDGATSVRLPVSYSLGGTAISGTDYVGLSGTTQIPQGASYVDIPVVPIVDRLMEGNETVVLTLAAGIGYTASTPTSGTVTIVDMPPVAKPSFNLTGGYHPSAQCVHVDCAVSGTMHYTVNSDDPTENSPCVPAGGDIPLQSGANLIRVRAFAQNYPPSDIASLAIETGVKLVGGYYSTLALDNYGKVWAWGYNEFGGLGIGNTSDQTLPQQISGTSCFVDIAAATNTSALVNTSGAVWCSGLMLHGALGNGTNSNTVLDIPVQVQGLDGVSHVASRNYHTLAVKANAVSDGAVGTVWAWGYNNYGQLGSGTTTDSSTPIRVSGSNFNTVAAGDTFSLALKNDGTVWTWGNGQLGTGGTHTYTTPVQVQISDVVAIAAGVYHCLALKGDGTVWGWGYNDRGQLGSLASPVTTPTQITGLDHIVAIDAGGYNSSFLKSGSNGSLSLILIGHDGAGQLGTGTTGYGSGTIVTGTGQGFTGISAVAVGYLHTLTAQFVNGVPVYWGWGDNSYGECGTTGTSTLRPALVHQAVDTDGDGISDWQEVQNGTNPNTNYVNVTAAIPAVPDNSTTPGDFRISRTGPTTSNLLITYSAAGSAAPNVNYVSLSGNAVIPSGASFVDINVVPIVSVGTLSVVLTLTTTVADIDPSHDYFLGPQSSATVNLLDGYNDNDGDGYPDSYEAAAGSNPDNASSVPTATYVVDANGNGDYTTIQAAINAVTADYQIILVKPGSYRENITSKNYKILLLSASGPRVTTIDGGNVATTVNMNNDSAITGFSIINGLGNSANAKGGGVTVGQGRPRFTNCLITQNNADNGAAVYTNGGMPSFVYCTIFNNTSAGASIKSAGAGAVAIFKNSILWDSGVAQEITGVGVNVSHCDVYGVHDGEGNINLDPLLNADGHLLAGSPCINAGTVMTGTVKFDMDGEPRLDNSPDIGADHYSDIDGNGLPDWWENDYHIPPGTSGTSIAPCGLSYMDAYHQGFNPNSIPPAVDITAVSGTAYEYNAIQNAFTVTRNSTQTDQPLNVYYTVGGDAVSGSDYRLLSSGSIQLSGTIQIPAGSASAQILLQPKNVAEKGDQYVILNLTADSTYQSGTSTSSVIKIIDNSWEDNDHDGYPNIIEAVAGTDPNDFNSIPAPTFTVDGNSGQGDYDSIQDAIDNVTLDYSIIYVRPGTYNEQINISTHKILLISGTENGEATTIDACFQQPAIYANINCAVVGFGVTGGTIHTSLRSLPTTEENSYMPVSNLITSSLPSELNCGGILINQCSARFSNCVIYGNSGDDAAAIYNYEGSPFFTNCTIYNNGGQTAIYCSGTGATFVNSILWDPCATEIDGDGASVSYCDVCSGSIVYPGMGNINSDPWPNHLVDDPSGHHDMHLFDTFSPCLGAGTLDCSYTAYDIDGDARPGSFTGPVDNRLAQIGTMDIGADQFKRDGVSIWWQLKYFSPTDSEAGPNDDPDMDGVTNLVEFRQGTDPTDYYRNRTANVIFLSHPLSSNRLDSYLETPLLISVTDTDGNAMPNAPVVIWISTGYGGVALSATASTPSASLVARTDSNGVASVYFMGTELGEFALTAQLYSANYPTSTFTGEITTPNLVITSGSNQSGVVDQFLAQSLSVYVSDSNNNPLPNVPITYTIPQGVGILAPAANSQGADAGSELFVTITTDTNGYASARFMPLASNTSEYVITASICGMSPVFFGSTLCNNSPDVTLLVSETTTITSATNVLYTPSGFTLTATPSGALGSVDHVEFYQNGILSGTVSNPPYIWQANSLAPGNYQFSVVAYCISGTTAVSNSVKKTVVRFSPVAAGPESCHAFLIHADGGVDGWGGEGNDVGQLNSDSLLNVTGVASGWLYSSFVQNSGTGGVVTCSGTDTYNRTSSQNLDSSVYVTCGYSHSLAIAADGSLWAWGFNDSGQLGIGEADYSETALHVLQSGTAAFKNVIAAAAGQRHSLAITGLDGQVWAWGNNEVGQIGDNTQLERDYPVKVVDVVGNLLRNATALACGDGSGYALLDDGTVWSWGSNAYGQLGDGTTHDRSAASQVLLGGTQIMTHVVALAGGASHCLALMADGSVWTWGLNRDGQLGDGTQTNHLNPVQVMVGNGVPLSGIVAISAGKDFSVAMNSSGKLFTWGSDWAGQVTGGGALAPNTLYACNYSTLPQFGAMSKAAWELKYFGRANPNFDWNSDPDGDGLTNLQEYQMGTDPTKFDTDGVNANGHNDWNADSDGDGLTNLQEYKMGTNPTKFDTDGDGVGDGADVYPLDPAQWGMNDPNDHTPPTIIITKPIGATLNP